MIDDTLPIASEESASSPSSTGSQDLQTMLEDPDAAKKRKKRNQEFRSRIDACKIYRRKLVQIWTMSIDYRRGKPFASQTDEDRIVVPIDWSMTKAKQAALFSQTPQIHVDHAPQSQQAGPWLYAFEQKLNDTIVVAGIESAMDEVMPDCINAAGIGVVLISHESITVDVPISAVDPMAAQDPNQPQLEPVTVPKTIDHRYTICRISPADFLWPINFTGSDFDNAPWLGRTGRISWSQAVQRFKLKESDRDSIMGEERTTMDRLTHDIDKDKTIADEMVGFDEIFYKEFQYDEDAKSYATLHHMVYVQGKDEPVIDEPWKGQNITFSQEGTIEIVGALKFPIRVLTLSYITDETIPPSDSAMGRSQVNEINKSRTQMILQRERSLPVRWFDVNRVDPAIQQGLMRGTWQAMIPVQGQGANIIGEVVRSPIPPENFKFDEIAKQDLSEIWQMGPNQAAGTGEQIETKAESNNIQAGFTARIGRERAKVGKFFVSIGEVLGGLICLYEPATAFGKDFDPGVCRTLAYSILEDSTVLIDSNQRIKRLVDFLNFSAKSGWVNIEPVLKEIATLSGLDPTVVIVPPQPKPPVEPNISLRLTGVEDMLNPLTLAVLIKSGQAPTPELIEQAKQLIQQAVTPPPMPALPGQPGGLPGPEGAQTPLPEPPHPLGASPDQVPPPPVPQVGEAHPNWGINPHVTQRTEDETGGNQ